MQPVKKCVRGIGSLPFQQENQKDERTDIEQEIRQLEDGKKLDGQLGRSPGANFEHLHLQWIVDTGIVIRQALLEHFPSPEAIRLHIPDAGVEKRSPFDCHSHQNPNGEQNAGWFFHHRDAQCRNRSNKGSRRNRMATMSSSICPPSRTLFRRSPVTELRPVRFL